MKILNQMEDFLNLPRFFSEEHFDFSGYTISIIKKHNNSSGIGDRRI